MVTIDRVIRFLEDVIRGGVKARATSGIEKILKSNMKYKVFTSVLEDVWNIQDAEELRSLIKTGSEPTIRGTYNEQYKKWKKRYAPFPHVVSGKLKRGTNVSIVGDKVVLSIPASASTATRKSHVYNFGPIHEARKSILKSTVAFSWQEIRNRIRNTYKRALERA